MGKKDSSKVFAFVDEDFGLFKAPSPFEIRHPNVDSTSKTHAVFQLNGNAGITTSFSIAWHLCHGLDLVMGNETYLTFLWAV